MKSTKLFFTIAILFFVNTVSYAKKYSIKSPDGLVTIEVKIHNEQLYYQVTQNKNVIIDDSKMTWSVNNQIFGNRIDKITVSGKEKKETHYNVLGGHSCATNKYKAISYKISSVDLPAFFLEVRAYDQGVAFRYSIDNSEVCEIDDFTEFTIPSESKVWSQDNIKFYEGLYEEKDAEQLTVGQIAGPPLVIQNPQFGIYSVISEAGLVDFAGMGMEVTAQRTYRTKLDGKSVKSGNIQTPWRVIIVGSLNTLVNNDMIANLSEESPKDLFINSQEWIKPGKCVWSWMTGTGVSFENMKKFSKLSGELGIEYNLVDEGWSSWQEGDKDGWTMMKELVEYSAAYNVKIWAWKAYPDRKGIPGIQTPERRTEFFKKCKEIGIVGLKIDFFDNEKQEITKYYQETLHEAAKFRLMINFHGCNKATGLNRTYPNEMTREGIRGYEYGMNVDCNVTLPFTRLIVGHGDYTPMYLNEAQMKGTSMTHQLASALVFSSPLLCLAAHPEEMLKNPNSAFISSLPTIWDETIVLPPSEIGKIVLLAKRKGNDWYIAGMTKEEQPSIEVELSFLKRGSFLLHSIKDELMMQNGSVVDERIVNKKDKLHIRMNSKGGFVARLKFVR